MAVMGLENVEHPEYGVATVDRDLLNQQIEWLAGLGLGLCEEQEGLLNLLGAIMDLTEPLQDETAEEA